MRERAESTQLRPEGEGKRQGERTGKEDRPRGYSGTKWPLCALYDSLRLLTKSVFVSLRRPRTAAVRRACEPYGWRSQSGYRPLEPHILYSRNAQETQMKVFGGALAVMRVFEHYG
ncbi:hypothetical protein DA2_0933 [Desulfovibrio sp. A2]|nr:hypothetical protein DA2_0933 [Desulfovibrio sp. A2]